MPKNVSISDSRHDQLRKHAADTGEQIKVVVDKALVAYLPKPAAKKGKK